MSGRHFRCPICNTGRLLTVELSPTESVSSCDNDACPTNSPTVAAPTLPAAEITDRHRALAAQEVAEIRAEMTDRHRRGEWFRSA